jgi:hypothetical protein
MRYLPSYPSFSNLRESSGEVDTQKQVIHHSRINIAPSASALYRLVTLYPNHNQNHLETF